MSEDRDSEKPDEKHPTRILAEMHIESNKNGFIRMRSFHGKSENEAEKEFSKIVSSLIGMRIEDEAEWVSNKAEGIGNELSNELCQDLSAEDVMTWSIRLGAMVNSLCFAMDSVKIFDQEDKSTHDRAWGKIVSAAYWYGIFEGSSSDIIYARQFWKDKAIHDKHSKAATKGHKHNIKNLEEARNWFIENKNNFSTKKAAYTYASKKFFKSESSIKRWLTGL